MLGTVKKTDLVKRSLVRNAQGKSALILSAGFISGMVIFGKNMPPIGAVILILLTCGLMQGLRARRAKFVLHCALLLLCIGLGAWRFHASQPGANSLTLSRFIGQDIVITGTIVAEPELLDHGQTLRLNVSRIAVGLRPIALTGIVLIHVASTVPFIYGQQLQASGHVAAPPNLPGTSLGAYPAYLASQDIFSVMDFPRISLLGSGKPDAFLALAVAIRVALEQSIRAVLPHDEAMLLIGILLGERTRALGTLLAPFVTTGMIHVVAVSGLKVSLIAGVAYRTGRVFVARQWAALGSVAVMLAYIVLTGATPAGLRSGVMWIVALAAVQTGRRSNGVTSLALTTALLGWLTPGILWDIGFQMSVAGTGSIILVADVIEQRLTRLPSVIRESLAVTLAAQVGTLPLLIGGFGQVSLVSPLANALLIPLLTPILLIGFPIAVLGAVMPAVGNALSIVIVPLLATMIAVVQALSHMPGAALLVSNTWLATVTGWFGPVYYVLLLALIGARTIPVEKQVGAKPVQQPQQKWKRILTIVAIGSVVTASTVAWQWPKNKFTVWVLAIGHGQAIVVSDSTGQSILIDGGDSTTLLDQGLGQHVPFWHTSLRLVALTDVTRATAGGLRDILQHYSITQEMDPGASFPASDYVTWRASLRARQVPRAAFAAATILQTAPGTRVVVTTLPSIGSLGKPVWLQVTTSSWSLLTLNRAALSVDVAAWPAIARHRASALVLPSGATSEFTYSDIIHLLHPTTVVFPNDANQLDNSNAVLIGEHSAQLAGIRYWQLSSHGVTTNQTAVVIFSHG